VTKKNANLTTEEAAELLGVSEAAVRQAIKRGRLRATKPGRDWQIARRDAESYLAERAPKGPRRKPPP
jgi:excisionase family DNA binding protein